MAGSHYATSRSIHLVDPQLREFLRAFPIPKVARENLEAVRILQRTMFRSQQTVSSVRSVTHEQRFIRGAEGAPDVRVLIFTPKRATQAPRPAYLFLHGGGYVMGAPEFSTRKNQDLAERLDCVVVAPGYRLAPETVFPGAIEDCYATLRWLHHDADALGIDRRRIAIGGQSAGAGLAASLALLARDRGEPAIAGQVLAAPMLDDRTGSTREPAPHVGEFIWTAQSNRFGWASLLGHEPGGEDVSAYAAAARTADVSGLPRTSIFTGALDLFARENTDYARCLVAAGVPTEHHIYPGAYHGFELVEQAEVSRRFARDFDAALRRCLFP